MKCTVFSVLFSAFLATLCWAQSFNASVSGTVTDPSEAVVPNVQLTLTAVATGAVAKATSGPDGLFRMANLEPGSYELKAPPPGARRDHRGHMPRPPRRPRGPARGRLLCHHRPDLRPGV
jgi:hypothetical protein